MELLDNKHVQSLGGYLSKLIKGLAGLQADTLELLAGPSLFPVEVDLSNSAFQYKSTTPIAAVKLFLPNKISSSHFLFTGYRRRSRNRKWRRNARR